MICVMLKLNQCYHQYADHYTYSDEAQQHLEACADTLQRKTHVL